MIKKTYTELLWVLSCILMIACSEDDKTFTIGENLVDVKSNVVTIDTTTINTFTILADSVQTSGYSKSLAGSYTDGVFGTVSASSYFRLALPSDLTLATNARFDSISLILKPSGYCYGDSTKPFPLQVHRLTENLENSDITYRYNTSKVSYSSAPLGIKTSIIRPVTKKELNVRLNDDFGNELFNLILNEAEEVEDQTNFLKYLKGLAITTDVTNSFSIMQFDASDSITKMRLYYHEGQDTKTLDFSLTNTSYQYNRIDKDYTNSPLKALIKKEDKLSSDLTNKESYCQAGTGLMTRIEFPNLKAIFEMYKSYKILNAELIIKPVKNTYDLIPLPSAIYLYNTNTINDIGSVLTDSEGNTISSQLVTYYMYNEQTAYYFDVTDYLTYQINYLKDSPPALILSFLSTSNGNSLERLIVGNHQHPSNAIKLNITIWHN